MSVDVKITKENLSFKLRANGIIIKDNKILVVMINNSGFYCLPGGHVELNEDSKTAVVREVLEETGVNVSSDKLIAIAENFFPGVNSNRMHEIGIYYTLKTDDEIEFKDHTKIENDKGKETRLDFKWVDISNLDTLNFRPTFLKDKITSNDFSFTHIIIND